MHKIRGVDLVSVCVVLDDAPRLDLHHTLLPALGICPRDELDQPRTHLEPHVPALATAFTDDPTDVTPPLGRAGPASLEERIRERKAAVTPP